MLAAAAVDLHDLDAVTPAGVGHGGAHGEDAVGALAGGGGDPGVVEPVGRVGQAPAQGEGRLDAEAVQEPLAVPPVVGDGRPRAVEGGQVVLAGRDGEGQAAGGVDGAAEDVGEGVAALHAGVPHHDDGGDLRAPGLHHDRAGAYEGDDGARVGGCDRRDDLLVDGAQAEGGAVAAVAVGHDRVGVARGLGGALGQRRVEAAQDGVGHGVGADPLALVVLGEAGDDHGHVRLRGGLGGGLRVVRLDVQDLRLRVAGRQAFQRCDVTRGTDLGGAGVAHVLGRGQATDDRDRGRLLGQRQDGHAVDVVVLEQGHGAVRDLAREGAVLVTGEEGQVLGDVVTGGVGAQLGAQEAHGAAAHIVPGDLTGLECPGHLLLALLGEGLLEIETGLEGGGAVAQAPDEVGDGDALPAPLLAQHGGEEVGVLPGPLAVDGVVGAHDGGDALVDGALEVGQVLLVEGGLVDGDVDLEALVLHGVQGVVLGAGHGVALDAAGEGGAHLAQDARVLAVGLLDAAPGGVAGQVDAHPAEEVAAHGAHLGADGVTDALLKVGVPGGAARHRDGEGGAVGAHAPAWAVDEAGAGDAQTRDLTVDVGGRVVPGLEHLRHALPERGVAVEKAQALLLGQLVVEASRLVGDIGAAANGQDGLLECCAHSVSSRLGAHASLRRHSFTPTTSPTARYRQTGRPVRRTVGTLGHRKQGSPRLRPERAAGPPPTPWRCRRRARGDVLDVLSAAPHQRGLSRAHW